MNSFKRELKTFKGKKGLSTTLHGEPIYVEYECDGDDYLIVGVDYQGVDVSAFISDEQYENLVEKVYYKEQEDY